MKLPEPVDHGDWAPRKDSSPEPSLAWCEMYWRGGP